MKKVYLVLLFFTVIGLGIFSQTNAVLDGYIKSGFENNLALKQEKLNLEKSLLALKEANGMFYPSVYLNAQYTLADGGRSINLPVGDMLNPVYSTLNQLLQNAGQQGNFPQISNQKIQFLPNDYHDTKFRVIIPLVNAEIYFNRKIKKEMITYSQAETNVYKRELVKEIKTAYFKYLQALKVVEAYNSALTLVAEGLRVNEKLVNNQVAGIDKLLRMRAELSSVEAQLTKSENDKKTALAYFNFLLNRPLESVIIIDSALFNNANPIIKPIMSEKFDREELIQIKSAANASKLLFGLKKSYYIPTISNITDLGYQGYQYKFNADQQYVMNVVDLRWNLFEGFQNKQKISQAKIDVQTLELKQSETEQQIALQLQIANNNIESSMKAEKANESSLASSKEYYKTISKQYTEGQKSLLDLLDARNQLTSAQISYHVSHFETLIRTAELERASASYDLNK